MCDDPGQREARSHSCLHGWKGAYRHRTDEVIDEEVVAALVAHAYDCAGISTPAARARRSTSTRPLNTSPHSCRWLDAVETYGLGEVELLLRAVADERPLLRSDLESHQLSSKVSTT